MHTIKVVLFIILLLIVISSNTLASEKTIYIKPFAIRAGVSMNDPSVTLIKDYISEYITEKEEYIIITDDEVKQIIKHEELKMALDKCYDDSCIKKLMKSIKTDYIIYGTFAYINYKYIITAKMLDRTSGAVRLAKVKTLEFKNKNKMKKATKDLAAYIIDDEDIDMDEYEEIAESERIDELKRRKQEEIEMAWKYKYYNSWYAGASIDYVISKDKYVKASKNIGYSLIFNNSYYNWYHLGVGTGLKVLDLGDRDEHGKNPYDEFIVFDNNDTEVTIPRELSFYYFKVSIGINLMIRRDLGFRFYCSLGYAFGDTKVDVYDVYVDNYDNSISLEYGKEIVREYNEPMISFGFEIPYGNGESFWTPYFEFYILPERYPGTGTIYIYNIGVLSLCW